MTMLTVPEYIQYITADVYQASLHNLQQCTGPETVALWKQQVCRQIYAKRVQGEPE